MNIKQTIRNLTVGLFMVFGLTLFLAPSTTFAACAPDATNCCVGVETSIISCEQPGGDNAEVEDTGLWGILILAINILSAGVGVVALGGIVYASILYTSAGGNQEQVKKAMGMITNIVIGIVAYALMFSALNFLIPGGLFN